MLVGKPTEKKLVFCTTELNPMDLILKKVEVVNTIIKYY